MPLGSQCDTETTFSSSNGKNNAEVDEQHRINTLERSEMSMQAEELNVTTERTRQLSFTPNTLRKRVKDPHGALTAKREQFALIGA